MPTELRTPDVAELSAVVSALKRWQRDDAPIQLHPGDLGWAWRSGGSALAGAVRTWSRNDEIIAIGFLDGADVLRMTVAPAASRDVELAHNIVADLSEPERGILPAGKVSVEVPDGTQVQGLLSNGGWSSGESWTPLRLDLSVPVEQTDLGAAIVVCAEQVAASTAVHRSAWGNPGFTDEKWNVMAAGAPFVEGWTLLARDDDGVAVATVTAWSAGPGKPGLLEPLGVHADHRRRGHGARICRDAAALLQKMGSASVLVCTPTSLPSAVGTYEAAGFRRQSERRDRTRDG